MYNCPTYNNLEGFKTALDTDWAVTGGVLGIFAKDGPDQQVFDKFVKNAQESFEFAVTWNVDDFKTLYPFVGESGVVIIKPPILCNNQIEQCFTVVTRFTTVVALRFDVLSNYKTFISLMQPGMEEILLLKTKMVACLFFNFDYIRDQKVAKYHVKRFKKIVEDRIQEAPFQFAIGSV